MTTPPSLRGPGGVASFYRPKDSDNGEYIDEYIAADYSQYYYNDGSFTNPSRDGDIKRFIDVDNKVIHEPIINFRHVFHVVDGRKFADESSKDVQSNEEFLARELMQFYARANKDFKIRIINPMPEKEGVHSNRYYKKADGTYERMGTYEIQTYRFENHVGERKWKTCLSPTSVQLSAQLSQTLKPNLIPACSPPRLGFRPTRRSIVRSNVRQKMPSQAHISSVWWQRLSTVNVFISTAATPKACRCVTSLSPSSTKIMPRSSLKKKSRKITRRHILKKISRPKSSVDFDKYMALSGNTDFMEPGPDGYGERIKYPVPWLNSEYAFGYKYLQDYGTYTIASHAECVPYNQATKQPTSTEWDRHDRLYKNTNGEKQGFFYYANAAGDPGVMARVDIPSVCIGSTLHVSAWINSMGVYMDTDYDNNEPANVNFDLIAIMKDGREVNINNFSTGYVPNDLSIAASGCMSITP